MPGKRTIIQRAMNVIGVPADYPSLLSGIKQRIASAQVRATLSVNSELVRLYWDIGRELIQRQAHAGWGAAVIPTLARDIRNDLPEIKGFSERNIGYMIRFAREYCDPAFLQRPVARSLAPRKRQLPAARAAGAAFLQQPVAKLADRTPPPFFTRIPWGHHILLLEKIKDLPDRLWYMQQTLTNGWSRNVLLLQICSGAHKRHGKAITNFSDRLPPPQSDLAQQALKDPYIFDFLSLKEHFQERELETGLLRHLEKFLLELGQGFAFVGRQYHVEVGEDDFYIDLLFYHLRLRSFIVIDLKKGEFKAEYAGKMNLYCNIVDDRLRHAGDQPTIGLILCQYRNRLVAEYALKGVNKAIGVSEYQLTRALPANLKSSLPSIEEIEAELSTTASTKRPRRRKGGA